MAHDYNRVKKGMVFWASLSGYGANKKFNVNDKEYESCLFFGTAPWVVLSVGNGIRAPSCEKVVTIAPIIPNRPKDDNPAHVSYIFSGIPQTILLERMETVDVMLLREYVCILEDDIIRQIDAGITAHFNIRPSVRYMDITMDNIVYHLEEVVKRIIAEQMKNATVVHTKQEETPNISKDAIENAALSLASNLEMLLKKPSDDGVNETDVQCFNEPCQGEDSEEDEIKVEEASYTELSIPVMKADEPNRNNTIYPSDVIDNAVDEYTSSQAYTSTHKYDGLSPSERFKAKFAERKLTMASNVPVEQVKPDIQTPQTPVEKAVKTRGAKGLTDEEINKRLEFISDCETLTPDEVKAKYNIPKSKIASTKYAYRSYLKKQGYEISDLRKVRKSDHDGN